MSQSFQSAVAFRNDICDNVTQLRQRGTRPLPDGATVYVVGTTALYRLVKGLGDDFDAFGSIVVVPTDGSDNRWVEESLAGASPWAAQEIASASVNVTPSGQFQWTALGSTAGSFALATGNALAFVVNPTTSLLTYQGVPRQMNLRYQASVLCGAAATINAEAAISVNGDVPAGNTSEHRGSGNQSSTVTDTSIQCIAGERSALLIPGATVRLMLRNMNGTQAISVEYFALSIAPD